VGQPSTLEPKDAPAGPRWPIVSGRYIVGNPERSVAVCTLASSDLVDQIGCCDEIAIVGRLYTLNLGLEKLVWNVVSNSSIRFLILCGDDTSAPISPGIVNLHDKGLDGERRIRGVHGYQPFVYNLTDEEVDAFQQHVEVVSLIGELDRETILTAARQLEHRSFGRWGEGIRHAFPEPLGATRNRMGDIKLEPRGLLLVGIRRETTEIVVDHYSADRRYRGTVVGTDAEAICQTLVRAGLLSELSHAAYIGREVAKAEEALRYGLEYEQDRPLFPIGQGGRWAPFGRRLERPAGGGRPAS
jgi:tetrahydromethanopterin S-methyltransferase subunit A